MSSWARTVFLSCRRRLFRALLTDGAQALDEKRYQMFRLFLIASFFGLPQVSMPLKTQARRWEFR